MDEKLRKFILNARGDQGPSNANEIINMAQEDQLNVSPDDVYNINKMYGRSTGGVITPRIVTKFISKTTKSVNLNVLIPWNKYGEWIWGIKKHVNESVIITENKIEAEITENLVQGKNHHVINGNPLKELANFSDNHFGLICGFPPLRYRVNYQINNQQKSNELGHLIILNSIKLLKKDGQMFFIVTEDFFSRKKKENILPLLEERGIYLSGAFYLPPGTLYETAIGTYLIALGTTKYDDIFVGELKEETVDKVIKNWLNRKDGKALQLGKMVKSKDFFAYDKLEKEIKVNQIIKRSKFNKIALKDVTKEINGSLGKTINDFEHKNHSIYIPNIGLSNVVSDPEQMKNKPQNYFQVVLSDDVNINYITKWFNTKLGQMIRETLMSGSTIKNINKSTLQKANLYLPEKNIQNEINIIQNRIENLKIELSDIENKAWNFPHKHKELGKKVSNINKDDAFSDWMETLPFPLASILYKYYAKSDVFSKKEFLLHFFEAFSQFQVMLMLSSFTENGENLNSNYKSEIDIDKLTRAAFGNWVYIGRNLAKKIRTMIHQDTEQCLRLFQHKNKEFIEVISSKDIYKILDRTNSYRNDWKGHGGVENENRAKERLVLLEKELQNLRKIIGDIFIAYKLIQPGNGHFSDDLFHCNCNVLQGSRNTFVEEKIELLNGLDIKYLYLYEKGSFEALKLLPFIKMMPSPKTQVNACYFYNRIENDGIRMVSYYFDQDAEVTIDDGSISSIIQGLD